MFVSVTSTVRPHLDCDNQHSRVIPASGLLSPHAGLRFSKRTDNTAFCARDQANEHTEYANEPDQTE
jgi:hypothetical protein